MAPVRCVAIRVRNSEDASVPSFRVFLWLCRSPGIGSCRVASTAGGVRSRLVLRSVPALLALGTATALSVSTSPGRTPYGAGRPAERWTSQ